MQRVRPGDAAAYEMDRGPGTGGRTRPVSAPAPAYPHHSRRRARTAWAGAGQDGTYFSSSSSIAILAVSPPVAVYGGSRFVKAKNCRSSPSVRGSRSERGPKRFLSPSSQTSIVKESSVTFQ